MQSDLLDMQPSMRFNDLHLIDQAHRPSLHTALSLCPPSPQLSFHLPVLRPRENDPSPHPVLPKAPRDLEVTDPASRRMDGIVRFLADLFERLPVLLDSLPEIGVAVPHTDVRIDPNAQVFGQRVVCVDEAAFRALDVFEG